MRIRPLFISAVSLLLLAMPAQADDKALLQKQFNEAYKRLLEKPNNRALTLEYAGLAMQLHDYEAAIPPLERVLMNEPDNAKLRVQLGVLYNALGSKTIAKEFFQEAINTPGAPKNIVQQAEAYLHGL